MSTYTLPFESSAEIYLEIKLQYSICELGVGDVWLLNNLVQTETNATNVNRWFLFIHRVSSQC